MRKAIACRSLLDQQELMSTISITLIKSPVADTGRRASTSDPSDVVCASVYEVLQRKLVKFWIN